MEREKIKASYGCVVMGAGEIRDYEAVSALLEPDAFVICADGGLKHCPKMNLRPHLLVGDLDSLETALPAGLELVALGPFIEDVHGPDERMDPVSFLRCYDFLVGFLARLG